LIGMVDERQTIGDRREAPPARLADICSSRARLPPRGGSGVDCVDALQVSLDRVDGDEDSRDLLVGSGPGGTAVHQPFADALGIPPSQVRFELGDTHLPEAPRSGV
jgi:hypothetical protein